MGMRLFGSSCKCGDTHIVLNYNKVVDNNPDPQNFNIQQIDDINGFKLVIINYPDCNNFEGDKILIYDSNITEEQIKNQKFLDPHFCESKEHISPIARFRPDKNGILYAITFCENFDKT